MTSTGRKFEFKAKCPKCGAVRMAGSDLPEKARIQCFHCGRSFAVKGRMVRE